MIFLNEMKENVPVYTFGKITKILGNNHYKITYKSTTLKIFSEKPLRVNEWVKFYGIYKDEILIPKVLINVTAYDINSLVKSICKLRE